MIRGIKKLKNEFMVRRRQLLEQNNEEEYKKIVWQYKKLIDQRLESNLHLIAKKVNNLSKFLTY